MRNLIQGMTMATVAVASVLALAVVAPAQAQLAGSPSDSLIIRDATGTIFEAVYGFELGEDPTTVHSSSVAIDSSQFGNATTLTEGKQAKFSDIVGIYANGNGGMFLSFASDSATQAVNFGTFPRTVRENGPIDVSLYLAPSLQANGWTATFTSDGVPEPATWAMMLTGFGGLGALMRRRRALAVAATA